VASGWRLGSKPRGTTSQNVTAIYLRSADILFQLAMNDTFLLSNIVPQDIDNNCGFWNRLEMYCRELTKRFDDVHIISGPLFLPCSRTQVDGKTRKFVQYEVSYPVIESYFNQ